MSYKDTALCTDSLSLSLSLQVPPLFVVANCYAVYCYVCPYSSTLANILEIALLASFMVLMHLPFLPLSSSYHVMTTDECGHPVLSGNVVAGVMAAVYYCTLVLSAVAMVLTFIVKKCSQETKCNAERKLSLKVLLSFKKSGQVPCQPLQSHSALAPLVNYTTAQVDLTETLDDTMHTSQDECMEGNC